MIRKLNFILLACVFLLSAMMNGVSAKAKDGFEIKDYKGAPALFIDGEPEFPMFLFEQEISQRDADAFQQAGVKLYSFIEKTSFLDLGWVGPGQQDFTVMDRVMQTFADRVQTGYALPRIHLWAPQWWLEQNPEESVGYALDPGQTAITRDASMASLKWRKETGEALRKMVRHLLDGPHANRLMGLTLAAGMYGEWHNWNAEYLPDTSEPMRLAFVKHLRDKYDGDVAKLRAAWKDGSVTFDSVTIPTAEERRTKDVGMFRDPAQSTRLIDYYEAYQAAAVEAIDYFAGIVKEESEKRLLVSVLYGYSPDMGYMPQEIHHRATALAHRLENVDLFTSPHSYWGRGPGDHGALRTYPASLALHGKLFIDEADDRTHIAPPGTSFVLAKNMEESLGILRRAFGQAVTHGTGLWYMDHSSGDWYNDPAFAAEFKRLKQWGDYSLKLPRQRISEVAVISSNESEFYLGNETDVTASFNEGPVLGRPDGIGELTKAGAPFDRYMIEDLAEGKVPDRYKVYIFQDAFYLTETQKKAIEKLKGKGRTLVWQWAPGFVSDQGLSRERMEQLTGFKYSLITKQMQDPAGGASWTDGFESGSFGESHYTPGFAGHYGAITSDPERVVSGSRSALGLTDASVEWFEFLYSDTNKIRLEPGATYQVSFNAKTVANPGGYFYFLARTASGGVSQDVGVNSWTDAAGGAYAKSFTFTLKNFEDYYLIWGIYNGGGLSVDDIKVTKIRDAGMLPLQFKLDPALFPGETTLYGETALDPLFRPDTAGAEIWGTSVKGDIPAVAVRDFGNWTSVYAGTTPIPAPALQRIYKQAGIHVYSDSYDNLEANKSWVSIHAATSGMKTIKLPKAGPVYDIIAGKLIGSHIREFKINMQKGQTAIFVLDDPSKKRD